MNEFEETKDLPQEVQEGLDLSSLKSIESTIEGMVDKVKDYWNEWFGDGNDVPSGSESTEGVSDVAPEASDKAREYGLQECADAAKEIFTTDVISNWGLMDVETRNELVQQYAEAIGKGMDINFKGVVWEDMTSTDGTYTYGYNSGDGYIHLNPDFLVNPAMLMNLVDTVAHEARHQMQREAIDDPEKFGIDEATVKEWTAGFENYTQEMPSAYDPWGYQYNPVEIDARYFGESMVRELTKDIINNA